jgi:hypothetical protein
LQVNGPYRLLPSHPIYKLEEKGTFPALAIPVATKYAFECPPNRLQALREFRPKVTMVSIIGCRGMVQHFQDLLKEHIKNSVRGMVVAGKRAEAVDIAGGPARSGLGWDWSVQKGGTDFAVNRRSLRAAARDSVFSGFPSGLVFLLRRDSAPGLAEQGPPDR